MPFSDELELPHIPGHEIFGLVGRTEPPGLVPTGTRVVVYQYEPCRRCASCRRGDEVLCLEMRTWVGFVDPGGFQERIVAPIDRLLEVPANVGAAEAAPMTCAIGTAYRSVVTRGGVRPGETVVVIGLGGVGIHAAQIAGVAGAVPIGVDVRDAMIEVATELGMRALRADHPDVEGAILSAHPTGVDAVIDTVSTDRSMEMAAGIVRRGGRIVAVGHGPTSEVRIATRRLVLDEIHVIGSRYALRHEMARAVALVGNGRIRPIVGMTRPLDRVNEALGALERGEVVGRAVIDVAGVA
jgi:D-arabinose 1-dehydrogenase-like Zn-dependent alcohol dehydrogenase